MAAHVASSSGRLMSAPSMRAAKLGVRRVIVIGVTAYGHLRNTSFSSRLGTVSRIQVKPPRVGHLARALAGRRRGPGGRARRPR